MPTEPSRIAMWSGPRNISTAMMRAWSNRPDTAVTDEPLYAHYLLTTGADHPGRDEVIAACETDWRKVVADLTGPVPGGKPIWYQKHMSHHLLPDLDRVWINGLRNCFLIRDPIRVLVSLARVTPNPGLDDTGLPQQVELFHAVRRFTGATPPVVDAADILADPRRALAALCAALGVPFDGAMLSWPPGPRPTDGVWASHWYAAVEQSTGFVPDRSPPPTHAEIPVHLRPLYQQCLPLYDELHRHRLLG